jgi:PhnB protein
MKANPFLSFNGNCAEAMAFYRSSLGGGTLHLKIHRDSPMAAQAVPEMLDKVMHAHLESNGVTLMAADIPSEHYTVPTPMVQVHLEIESDARAEEVFAALSEGATIFMPLQQTFWTSRFGMLKDKYGVPWMISSAQFPS